MLWGKEECINISGNKKKRYSIRIKSDLYEVCLSEIIYCLLFYFKTILIPFFPPARFVVSLSLGVITRSCVHRDWLLLINSRYLRCRCSVTCFNLYKIQAVRTLRVVVFIIRSYTRVSGHPVYD